MARSGVVANYANVQELASALRLDDAAYRRALEIAGLKPGAADWLRYLDRFLTAIGVLLVVAGVAAFVAWNWADLGRMAKFAIVQGGIVAGIAVAWRFGIDSVPGRVTLLGSAFLIGVLLALFGQVYQTGADPYGLFLLWAIAVLPLAIVGRQGGLWMLLLALLNLTLILYWTQVLNPPDGWWQLSQLLGPLVWLASTVVDSWLASWLFAMNAVALVLWEVGSGRGVSWMGGRWFPRVVAFGAFATVLIPTLIMIFAAAADATPGLNFISPVLFAASLALSVYYYQVRRLDLFILTIALFGAIMVIMSYVTREMFQGFVSALPLAALLVALVAAAAWWIREVSRRWDARA